MGHSHRTLRTFSCDHEGEDDDYCRSRALVENFHKQYAEKLLRRLGWTTYDGYACPLHNTKDVPECPECGSVLYDYERYQVSCRECGADADHIEVR